MTRKQFIEANGATCKNWNWSWSFINESERTIIFGAWDTTETGNLSMIFTDEWEFNDKKKRNAGYKQSLEHIRLVEEENYTLKTFPIYYSDKAKNADGSGPAKIDHFTDILEEKLLLKIDSKYYASPKYGISSIPEEVSDPEAYLEGTSKKISVNAFERNAIARKKCLEYYGYECQVCKFDFEKQYGQLGKDYIHVHHIIPLVKIKKEYKVNPITDLIPICPNCHAIIHRTKPALSIDTLKENINASR